MELTEVQQYNLCCTKAVSTCENGINWVPVEK